MENGKPVGKGVAFKALDFLTLKFNFTFNIVQLDKDIIGSKSDYAGSLVECLNESVCICSILSPRLSKLNSIDRILLVRNEKKKTIRELI